MLNKVTGTAPTLDEGPIAVLVAEWLALNVAVEASMKGPGDPTALVNAMECRRTEIEGELLKTEAQTPAEAIALLNAARADWDQYKGEPADNGDRLLLAAMDNAVSVLRGLAA